MTVERIAYFHENEIIQLMNQIEYQFHPNKQKDEQMMQGAVFSIRSNVVNTYRYDEANQRATVSMFSDGKQRVEIDFHRLALSCSCGSKKWCKHRLIAVFHMFLQYHSLTDWMNEWRKQAFEELLVTMGERTPELWNETLSSLMNPIRIVGLNENPSIFIHKFSLIEQKSKAIAPFEWEWKPIFTIYFHLHALDAAWPYLRYHLGNHEYAFSFGKWYVRNWLSEQLEAIEETVHSLSSKRQLFEVDPFYDDIRNQIRSLAIEKEELFAERFRLYRLCWLHLFQGQSLRREEQELLLTMDRAETYPLLAFFYMIEGNYGELTKITARISEEEFEQWFALTELAEFEEDTEALHILMRALLPFVANYFTKAVSFSKREMFVRKIDGLLESANFCEEEREKMFAIYGSAGVSVYADFLIERERFKEWAAFMHRYRVSYEIVDASGLRIAMKKDPEAVLPLLHLYALDFIEERNRQSYRRAVKVFRQMKNCAQKVGKQDFWNNYIETIRREKRRLRALMEEMEKGNLSL